MGVAFAGTKTGNVGTAFSGTFGKLTVNANGSYSYALDNLDRDTQLLSTGETAYDRFVITYASGGQTKTLQLDVAIVGSDEPGQATQILSAPIRYTSDATISADTYLTFTSDEGLSVEYWVSGINVVNNGAVRSQASSRSGISAASFSQSNFENNGRITVAGSQDAIVSGLTASTGINNGVISATQPFPMPSFFTRASGWGVGSGTNNGLIEVTSVEEAYGASGSGNFVNNGLIRVVGGKSGYGLGVAGYYSQSSSGQTFSNTGTIWVQSTDPATDAIGVYFRPNSSSYTRLLRITNSGTIVADQAVRVTDGLEVSTKLENSGHIEGDILFDTGLNTVFNTTSGTIVGAIKLGPYTDFLTNAGRITGTVGLGAGDDVYLGTGNATVTGAIQGEAGRDILFGSTTNDTLSGGDGDDWLAGGGGGDTLTGGAGNDTFAFLAITDSQSGIRDTITDFTSGSDKIDISALAPTAHTLTPSGSNTTLTVTNAAGTLSVTVTGTVALSDLILIPATNSLVGTSGNDVLVAQVIGSRIDGEDGSDVLFGTSGRDTMIGGLGDDAMIGGGGDDLYYVDSPGDQIIEKAGEGTDEVRTTVDFGLQNGIENAVLWGDKPIGVLGTDLDNVLLGNHAQNYFSGQAGDDTITGRGGSDFILTGTGADRVVYNHAAESQYMGVFPDRHYISGDLVADFQHGIDKIDLTSIQVTGFSFAETRNSYFVYFGPQMPFPVDISNWTDVTIYTDSGWMALRLQGHADLADFIWNRPAGQQLTIDGTAGDDQIDGTSDIDLLRGLAGNDTLSGAAGDDILFGGEGADILSGGDGADILSGDAGIDTLTGGSGADRFTYFAVADSPADDGDTITDFTSGTDILDLSAFPLWDLRIGGTGTNRIVSGTSYDGTFRVAVTGAITMADIVHQQVGRYLSGTSGSDELIGGAGRDYLLGSAGDDTLKGLGGNDFLSSDVGNDRMEGGAGIDTAIFADRFEAYSTSREADTNVLLINSRDSGADALTGIELIRFNDGLRSFAFAQPGGAILANFNPANGWESQDRYPRHVADVNGDGYGDIVGFGHAGVLVSLGAEDGSLSQARLVVANFGQTAGWTSDDAYHREMADVNGDGRADIVGFGYAGTLVSLARSDGSFDTPALATADFGTIQGWLSQETHVRTMADVNGDGFADIVGFGHAGTLVSIGNGDGTFSAIKTGLYDFGVNQGWKSDIYQARALADVDGDGDDDIVGSGRTGTFVALSQGDGTFAAAALVLEEFGADQGWYTTDFFPRFVVDVNGDTFADIVGLGATGIDIAYGHGDGTFSQTGMDIRNFGISQGWKTKDYFYRDFGDLNGDGLPEIIGFGAAGVLVAENQIDVLI